MKNFKFNRKGFTLIELLVAVIIIGVLAAIAVPQYKHAALKSRFNTVMPMAKSIADAQEVYFQGRQLYALGVDELDVTPVNAENTTVTLSAADEGEEFSYVAAQRSDVPGARYIMYQKYSPKFANTIHCEADMNNEDALWLCEKGLNGQEIEGSVRGEGYKTFLLAGTLGENDTFSKECPSEGDVSSQPCPGGCGTYSVTASCDTRTGNWEYEGEPTGECLTGPADTVSCNSLTPMWTGGSATRSASCNQDEWAYGQWNTDGCSSSIRRYYVESYMKARDAAIALAAQMESYYDLYHHYPSKTQLVAESWGGCWAPDGNNDVAYCCVSPEGSGGQGCTGGIGVGLAHAAYPGGEGGMHCWASNSYMSAVCNAETGNGTTGQRNYYPKS